MKKNGLKLAYAALVLVSMTVISQKTGFSQNRPTLGACQTDCGEQEATCFQNNELDFDGCQQDYVDCCGSC